MIIIINRITIPNSGEVLFGNRPITQADVERIGYLPEERGLYRKMEVGDQAMYLAQLKGMGKSEAREALKEWFVRFGIQDWWKKKVEELSKGMAQKVQFITTVVHKSEAALEGVDGVFRVLSDENNAGRHVCVLSMEEGVTINDVLAKLLSQGLSINSIRELVPRMNDIFIKHVTEEA